MSDEVTKPPAISNKIPIPELSYLDAKIKVKFDGSCLKQDKITYTHGTIVNIYIVYEFLTTIGDFNFTLKSCLFGAVKLNKNSDIDK